MYPAEWQNEVDFADTVADARYQPYLSAGNWYYANSWMPTSIAYKYPNSTVGKIFFKIPGDTRWYTCTASVFQRRALWTAGHCVYTPGKGWHTNVQFWPATRNGSQPYGVWFAKSLATTGNWAFRSWHAYDIGVVVVNDISGRTIRWWTGSLGTAFEGGSGAGWDLNRLWHALGYSGNLGSGNYLVSCQGSLAATWALTGPDPKGMPCVMTFGSSGGPWVFRYAPYFNSSRNYVNGVVSFGSQNGEFYSPVFGDSARTLYNWGRGQ